MFALANTVRICANFGTLSEPGQNILLCLDMKKAFDDILNHQIVLKTVLIMHENVRNLRKFNIFNI